VVINEFKHVMSPWAGNSVRGRATTPNGTGALRVLHSVCVPVPGMVLAQHHQAELLSFRLTWVPMNPSPGTTTAGDGGGSYQPINTAVGGGQNGRPGGAGGGGGNAAYAAPQGGVAADDPFANAYAPPR
jgi:hypothetical protein